MATSRSINPANLLKKDAKLLVHYLKQHDFEKYPYFISFSHLDNRIHLTHYIQKRMDENNQPYYFIIGEQIDKDNAPYDTYVIPGVLTIEKDQLVMTIPENHFFLDTKEINPYHLTTQENKFLYDLFKAATCARPRKLVFLERDHFAFPQGNVRFESDLFFTTKIIATRANKSPIGNEHSYRWRPLGELLGTGTFGEVFDASLKLVLEDERKLSAISTPVVMKVTEADAQHEYDMLRAVGAKPKRQTYFIDKDGYSKSVLGMRRYPGCELFNVLDDELRERKFLTATQRIYVALNFALRLKAIHQRGIMHLDLKPENTLVDEEGDVEIIDFGLSMPMAYGGKCRHGTFQYMAPEVFTKKKISAQSDIFSLACIFRAIFNVSMTISFLDKMESQYRLRLDAIDITKKDAEKKKIKCWKRW
ncbi:MAG: protein kinase [Gammaproteobacteria bacterium]